MVERRSQQEVGSFSALEQLTPVVGICGFFEQQRRLKQHLAKIALVLSEGRPVCLEETELVNYGLDVLQLGEVVEAMSRPDLRE